jgi:O-methyltransferase
MDLDPRSWWYNPDVVAATGGFMVPGDAVKRNVLTLEPWDTVRRDMIILLLRSLTERAIEGDLAELGVFRGNTARLVHHYLPERKFYLFDTFAGFDERDIRVEGAKTGRETRTTEFSDTTVEMARGNIAPQNDNVQFFPGYFPQSAPDFLSRCKFAMVHLDADLYEPMLAGLDYFYEKVVPGGFILVHDFNSWLGARKAVQDFFKDKPEIPVPLPDKSGSALITKQDVAGRAGPGPMGR